MGACSSNACFFIQLLKQVDYRLSIEAPTLCAEYQWIVSSLYMRLWLLSIQVSKEFCVILKRAILASRMWWVLFGFVCLEDLFCDFYRFDPVRFLRAPDNILFLYRIINSGVSIRWTTSTVDTQSTPYLLDCFLWVYGFYQWFNTLAKVSNCV